MQLFLSQQYTIHDTALTITDADIIHQCFHVLRMKPGEHLMLQTYDGDIIRYTISLNTIDKSTLSGTILSIDQCPQDTRKRKTTLCISIPNRHDKLELIIQKLAELSIDEIIFFPSARSIIRDIPTKKQSRLQIIAKEAVEQSFGRKLPIITTAKSLDTLLQKHIVTDSSHILLDHHGKSPNEITIDNKHIYAYIGPEGGFTNEEKQKVSSNNHSDIICLGTTNLRMETAAIITGWMIQQF